MKKIELLAFDETGDSVGRAAPVRRGRRSGKWRVEIWDAAKTGMSRVYLSTYAEALAELEFHGATRIDRKES